MIVALLRRIWLRLRLKNRVRRRLLRLRRGLSDESELAALPVLVPRDRTAIDVGANKGLFTELLSRCAREVIAYEPNPGLAADLADAVSRNVRIRPCGVSDRAGDAVFAMPIDRKGPRRNVAAIATGSCEGGATFTAPLVRLDDEDAREVGFMKIDVEGHEVSVIRGAEKLLARDKPTILIEVLDRGANACRVESLLTDLGYTCFEMRGGAIRPTAADAEDRTSLNLIYLATARDREVAA